MSHNTERTFTIEGMLEGPLKGEANRQALRSWIPKARDTGFPFHLTIEATTFCLMPEDGPFPLPNDAEGIDVPLTDLLNAFVANLDATEAAASMSTIRTSEYRPGTEVQTIYALEPSGRIKPQQRQVDAKTTPPPEPLTTKALLRYIGVSILFLGVVFAATYPFVPYRKLFNSFTPVKAEEIKIHLGSFDGILKVRKKWIARGALVMEVDLVPPLTGKEKTLDKAYFSAQTVEKRLALEAIVKKRLHLEVRNSRGMVIARNEVRLNTLVVPFKGSPDSKDTKPKSREITAIRVLLIPGIKEIALVL